MNLMLRGVLNAMHALGSPHDGSGDAPSQSRRTLARSKPPFGTDIGRISIKTLAAQIRVVCAPRAGSDKAIACNCGRQVRAGDQGVPQGADVRASSSDAGFGIYVGLPLACRMASDEIRLLQ